MLQLTASVTHGLRPGICLLTQQLARQIVRGTRLQQIHLSNSICLAQRRSTVNPHPQPQSQSQSGLHTLAATTDEQFMMGCLKAELQVYTFKHDFCICHFFLFDFLDENPLSIKRLVYIHHRPRGRLVSLHVKSTLQKKMHSKQLHALQIGAATDLKER